MTGPSSTGAVRAFLRRHVLFADVSEGDLEAIAAMTKELTLPEGETLISEGDPGDSLFIVVSGELEISRREGGREVALATRGPGEFVGELSLLQAAPRSATARTRTQTSLLEIR